MGRTTIPGTRAAIALACTLALASCDVVFTEPGGDRWADEAFGAVRVKWTVSDPVGGWTMRPALTATHVYFEHNVEIGGGGVLSRAQLVSLDRETGTAAWSQPMGTAENAAVAGDVIGAIWGSLRMFDRITGAPRSEFRYGQTSLSGNVTTDGARFYLLTHNGHALAVNPATGATDWDVRVGGTGFGVALEGDALAVAMKHFGSPSAPTDSGIVAVLDRGTGAVRWRVSVGEGRDPGITDPPVMAGGLVVTRSGGHDVRAWDVRTGAARWRFDGGARGGDIGGSGIDACDGMVIVPTGNLHIAALDAATGAVRWRVPADDLGSLFDLDCSHGAVLALGSRLAVHDARTGARRIRFPLRDPVDPRREFMIAAVTRDADFLYLSTTFGYAKITAPGR